MNGVDAFLERLMLERAESALLKYQNAVKEMEEAETQCRARIEELKTHLREKKKG